MSSIRVKFFSSSSLVELEAQVNQWLTTVDLVILAVRHAAVRGENVVLYSVLVEFTVPAAQAGQEYNKILSKDVYQPGEDVPWKTFKSASEAVEELT